MKGKKMPLHVYSDHPNWYDSKMYLNSKDYLDWLSSLQPCEISESELENVKTHLMPKVGYNTIDITSLVSDNNGVITFKEKQVDGEIEAVEFAEWCDKQVTYIDKNGNVDYKQLYEIFKNRKP